MRRAVCSTIAVVAVVIVSLAGPSRVGALPPEPTPDPPAATQLPSPERVSYCHRTASVLKPYVLLTTAVDSIFTQGHGGHAGPVFPAVGPDGQWGDIIPPFDFDNGQQQFPGLNWPSGSAILEAGCAVYQTIDPPPAETTTTSEAPTTTAGPTTTTRPTTSTPSTGTSTTTSSPSTSSTTTTIGLTTTTDRAAGGASTTSVAGGSPSAPDATPPSSTTTTTASQPTGTPPPTAAPTPMDPPPVSALAPGQLLPDPLPRVVAFVIVPGNNVVLIGVLSPEQVGTLYRELAERRLANTGNGTGALVPVAVLSLLGGGALLGLASRRRRTAS